MEIYSRVEIKYNIFERTAFGRTVWVPMNTIKQQVSYFFINDSLETLLSMVKYIWNNNNKSVEKEKQFATGSV